MGTDDEFQDFDNVCRLFPLPGFVVFPHAVVPLHIFEPRYRELTEDALAGDRRIALVKIRPGENWREVEDPAIEPVACLGSILDSRRLPDGRYNVLFVGRKRARILTECPKTRLYRRAEVELLEDRYPPERADALGEELRRLFRSVIAGQGRVEAEFNRLLDGNPPLGDMTDLMSHYLGLSHELKQSLLNEPRVDHRARRMIQVLQGVVSRPGHFNGGPDEDYPPSFSVN